MFNIHYIYYPIGSLQNVTLLTPENAVLGQSSVLTCEVHASLAVNTSLLSVQWTHEGSAEMNGDFVAKQASGAGPWVYVTELRLSETTVEQSGLYSCRVSLDTDRKHITAERNLTVACESHLIFP